MQYAVGSSQVRWYLAPGGHIGLFIGRQSQAEYWTPILAEVRELSRPRGTFADTGASNDQARALPAGRIHRPQPDDHVALGAGPPGAMLSERDIGLAQPGLH